MTTAPLYLTAAAGEAKQALTLGQGLPATHNGIACHYFWRPVIADGEYVHPVKGFRLAVDAKRRKGWEDNFRKMQAAGERVPVVKDHADDKSDATLGYVMDVRQNGAWLEELHQYLGDSARDVALRNQISVGIDPNYVTGTGAKLGDCIVHSATTPRPVVGGQGEAVPLAAARENGREVLELRASGGEACHWVTLEDGRHICIGGASGEVPARVKAEGGKNRFTKAGLEKTLTDYHDQHEGHVSAHDASELEGFINPTTFSPDKSGRLPEEVRNRFGKDSALFGKFRLKKPGEQAGGEDAMQSLGQDRYFSILENASQSRVAAAVDFAKQSGDPELAFLAEVHQHLPTEKGSIKTLQNIDAGGLRLGDKFTIGGERFHVAEDAEGLRVLRGSRDLGDVPTDALNKIPIDKGSFRPGKSLGGATRAGLPRKPNDSIPFSRTGRTLNLCMGKKCKGGHGGGNCGTGAGGFKSGNTCAEGGGGMQSHTGRGLFGQTVFDPATGKNQGSLFHEPVMVTAPEAERVGSKSANDPKHTGEMFKSKAGKGEKSKIDAFLEDAPDEASRQYVKGAFETAARFYPEDAEKKAVERIRNMAVSLSLGREFGQPLNPASEAQFEFFAKTIEALDNGTLKIPRTPKQVAKMSRVSFDFRSHAARTLNMN